jgi:hypothetical protein
MEKRGERRRGSSVPLVGALFTRQMRGRANVIGMHVEATMYLPMCDFAAEHRAALYAARVAVDAADGSSEEDIWGVSEPSATLLSRFRA